ncbi:MAG TPA: DinB family protein [Vicinamibacteria bacterium]|nr:DinB family protein [Vicinamibacteria bacterium]
MRRASIVFVTSCFVGSAQALGATGDGKALAAPLQFLHQFNQQNLIAAGKKMPDEKFDHRPAPAPVRSFGQILAHVADANYLFCSAAAGKPDPVHRDLQVPVEAVPEDALERKLHTKAEIVEALEASFAFCAGVFGELTDDGLAAPVEGAFGTRATALTLAVYHSGQHYGNVVAYMRAAGVDPPTALGVPGRR